MTRRAFPWHKRRSGLCRHGQPPFRGQDRSYRPSNPLTPWERSRPRISTGHSDSCCYAKNATEQSSSHKRRSKLRRHELPSFRGQDRSHRPRTSPAPWERSRPRTSTGHSDSCCYAKNATEQSSSHKRRAGFGRHGQPPFRSQDRSYRPSNPPAPWERSRPRTGTEHSDSCCYAKNATGRSSSHKHRSELRRHEQPSFRGQDRSHKPSSPPAPWERSRPRTGTEHSDSCCYAKNATGQSSSHKRRCELHRHEQPPFRGQDRSYRPSNPYTPWERSRPRISTEHGDGCCYAKNRTEQSCWHSRRFELRRHEQPLFAVKTAPISRAIHTHRGSGLDRERAQGARRHALLAGIRAWPTSKRLANE